MVCFTQHTFTFYGKQTPIYFPLLVKYYSGVDIKAIVADPRNKDAPAKEFKGKMTTEWLETIVSMGNVIDDSIICLETERFWSEYSCIKTLPEFVAKVLEEKKNDEDCSSSSSSLVEKIDGIIRSRTASSGNEVFHSCKFEPPASWANIIQALDKITETKNITRWLLCNETKAVIIVLKDRHTIIVGEGGAADFTLPIFDVDDGFIAGGFGGPVFPEFTAAFDTWKEKFTNSEGKTWNDAIWGHVVPT